MREKGRVANSCSRCHHKLLALDAPGTCCPPTATPGVYLHLAQDSVGSPPPFPADWRCPPARHTLLSQRAEDKSGSGCLGNRAASTRLPLAGRPYEAAPSGSPGSPSGGGGGLSFSPAGSRRQEGGIHSCQRQSKRCLPAEHR